MIRQSEFLEITCNWLKAREKKLRVQGAIAFGVASSIEKIDAIFFQPVTERRNCNRVITFDSHFKVALYKLTSGIAR